MNKRETDHQKNPIKIGIISFHGFGLLNSRPYLVKIVLEKMNFSTKTYFSNFDHIQKQHILQGVKNQHYSFIKVPPYQKNISIKRLYSYIVFSIKLIFNFQLRQENVLYVCVPCYFSLISALFYKWFFGKKL